MDTPPTSRDITPHQRRGADDGTVRPHTPSAASINRTISSRVQSLVNPSFASVFSGGGGNFGGPIHGGNFGVGRWAGLILKVLALLGQSPSWLSTVERRMNQESGGNPFAINLTAYWAAHGGSI